MRGAGLQGGPGPEVGQEGGAGLPEQRLPGGGTGEGYGGQGHLGVGEEERGVRGLP